MSQPGFEPGTKGLKVLCSTVELLAPNAGLMILASGSQVTLLRDRVCFIDDGDGLQPFVQPTFRLRMG